MTRSKRMRQIADIADSHVREAASAMAGARQALEQCEDQLAELKRYRDDYRERSAEYQGAGDPRRLGGYRVFLARLDKAIREQEGLVKCAKVELDRKTNEWRNHQTHAKVLEKVSERFRNEEIAAADRVEQREQDDRPVFRLNDRE